MDDNLGGASYSLSHRMVYGNLMYQGDGDNKENNNFEVYHYLNDTIFKKDEVEAFIVAKDIKDKINKGYLAFGKDTKGIRKIKYSNNTLAYWVKMADLKDNMDLSRLENITDKDKERVKRYQKAVDILVSNCD